jgi:tetratricopeptide (TPR) repeat protein
MIESPLNHPSDEALRALSLGQLSEAELAHVSAHLSDCPACCRRIDELATDDRLLARLQQSAASPEEVLVSPAQRRSAVRALRQGHETRLATRKRDLEAEPVILPSPGLVPQISETGQRYRLFGEIARGGMGAVHRGRDVYLDRELAVKVLLERYANLPEIARRFVEEAKIAGKLQHPGVVPVYDIGWLGDRPFFTMKLVEGKTLAAILGEREQPTEDRPRLLNIVLQVAQALAYAHSRGVIHRDLKPANVMVGAFGEVQVMDWGLAKVLAEDGSADEKRASRGRQSPEDATLIRTAQSSGSTGSGSTETEAGSVLGTPAYMPPEQAKGDIANLDRRADVFGLGAILCEVLTGKPPYVGSARDELEKAASGDLADAHARLDGCGAHPELIVLTKWCLSPRAIDRPRDAQGVADGLSAYLNGVQERLQATERDRAVALVRASEEGKRRKVQLALALALIGLLVAGGAFAFWRNEQAQVGRERDARNAEAVAALLGQAEQALKAGDSAKAHVALEAAKKRSAEGGAEQQAERLGQLDADLALLRDLDAVDQFRWSVIDNKLPDAAAVATRTREALARFGANPEAVSVDEAAARVSVSVVRDRIVSALDRLLLQQKSAAVRALLRRVDADPYRDALRDAVLANLRTKVVELAQRKAALEQPPGFVALLGEYELIPVERRRQLLQVAVGRPGDLGLLMTLGNTYSINQKVADECRCWFQAAVAAAPGNAAAHNNLGYSLLGKGKVDEAIACFRRAIELDRQYAAAHSNLGSILCDVKRDYDRAIACFHKAIELDPKLAQVHTNLGNARSARGEVDGAIASYQKAIALNPKLASAHHGLGNARRARGEVDDAIACYNKVIALDPRDADAHLNLGIILCDVKRDYDKGIACFKKAIELNPKSAMTHNNLGTALRGKGQEKEAIACFHKAIEIDPTLALPHFNLGIGLAARGQWDEAIAYLQKAVALDPKFARAHNDLGVALREKGQVEEAIDCYHKALALDPKYAAAHSNLGGALRDMGKIDEALACYQKAIAIDPNIAMAHSNLGAILCDVKRDYDGAIACFHKAIALDPKLARAHSNLGVALAGKGQLDEAIASLKKAIALSPKFAPARRQLARVERLAAIRDKLAAFQKGTYTPATSSEHLELLEWCQVKKLHHTAAKLYADAFTAEPKLADDLKTSHRYNAACFAALAAAGQGEDSAKLIDRERARLRKQALDWLRADLALWARLFDDGEVGRSRLARALKIWQQDRDLAGLRERAALAKLPAEEQKVSTQLWADVATLLKKAQEKPK